MPAMRALQLSYRCANIAGMARSYRYINSFINPKPFEAYRRELKEKRRYFGRGALRAALPGVLIANPFRWVCAG